jgi:hypothetical protein
MTARPHPPQFTYKPRPDEPFVTFVMDAALRGISGPLCDYLLSDLPLSPQSRKSLAWLITKTIPDTGRPAGPKDAITAFKQCAAYLVRLGKGATRMPYGEKERLAKRAIAFVEREYPDLRGKIRPIDIVGLPESKKHGMINWKPSQAVIAYVHEFMADAVMDMRAARP